MLGGIPLGGTPPSMSGTAGSYSVNCRETADGGFVPGLSAVDQVRAVAVGVDMPLNLMMLPGMAPVEDLFAAGARRLSAGPATFLTSYASLAEVARGFLECGETEPMFAHSLTYETLNQAFSGTVPA